jgi:cytochrome P450
MAMIKHPNVVEKAQLELDRVLGFAVRLPTFSDLDDLPYLRALCQEIHRWRPVSSGGFQHAITKDLRYKQYVLPKGNAIVGNHW